MTEDIIMRTTIFVTAVLAMVELLPRPSAAAVYYPWCFQHYDLSQTLECAFVSRDQCSASIPGIGGYCEMNPYPRSFYRSYLPGAAAPSSPPLRRPARHAHASGAHAN
jgi:hypothetical protein